MKRNMSAPIGFPVMDSVMAAVQVYLSEGGVVVRNLDCSVPGAISWIDRLCVLVLHDESSTMRRDEDDSPWQRRRRRRRRTFTTTAAGSSTSLSWVSWRLVALLVLLAMAANAESSSSSSTRTAETRQQPRQLLALKKMKRLKQRDHVVTGNYVVLLYDMDDLRAVLANYQLQPFEIYRHVLKGFAVQDVTEGRVLVMAQDARIKLVAEDGLLDAEEDRAVLGDDDSAPPLTSQSEAPWHLDRVDGNVDSQYSYRFDGAGIDVYIMDSGIRATHSEFLPIDNKESTRVAPDCFSEVTTNCNTDTDSHGTHVAGIVGGRTYGVAKGVTLHDVRIRDKENRVLWSYLYAGFDFIIAQQERNPNRKLIANLSYTGKCILSASLRQSCFVPKSTRQSIFQSEGISVTDIIYCVSLCA